MTIRKATTTDIPRLLEIFASAREYMKAKGNPTQWGDSYPEISFIEDDIAQGDCYTCIENDVVVATFVLREGNDPTYEKIYDGAWKNDNPYVTIHRIASTGQTRGVFSNAIRFALQKHKTIRIDTHRDNTVMQSLVLSHGFLYCGIIYCFDGTERLAYQLG